MKFKSYVAVMVASWTLAALAVIGFNVLVDALGILPVRAIAGFNEQKPLRDQYDRIVKRVDVRTNQPATIFLGSSRIKQSIDPNLLDGTPLAPAYNGAMDGMAELDRIRSYLRLFLKTDKNLRYVYIEAFPSALLSIQNRSEAIRFSLADDVRDYATVFFSLGGFSTSVRTIWRNARNIGGGTAAPFDGFAPVPLSPHHFSVKNIFNFILHANVLKRGRQVSTTAVLEPATSIIAECKLQQIDCRFFLSPMHADALLALEHLGLWPEFEKLKRELAKLAPTYDFTRHNDLIDERAGPVVYWPEAFHFSPALGALMVRVIAGLRTTEIPENFGIIIDSDNVESQLMIARRELDLWIARNPNAVARMRRAEDNFKSGMSFKAVTDAESSAGNW